jgi:hypothetical protein
MDRDSLCKSAEGHSRPMHSLPVPINVRCYSIATLLFGTAKWRDGHQ